MYLIVEVKHPSYHEIRLVINILVGAVLSSLLLVLVVIYYPPLQPIFHTVPILPFDWLLIIGLSSIPTFLLAGSFLLRKTK